MLEEAWVKPQQLNQRLSLSLSNCYLRVSSMKTHHVKSIEQVLCIYAQHNTMKWKDVVCKRKQRPEQAPVSLALEC